MKGQETQSGEEKQQKETLNPEIPKVGSLGIMAAGYRGIQMWRKTVLGLDPNDPRLVGSIINGQAIPIIPMKKEKNDEEK